MIDPTGKVIIELREDAAFGSWCGGRVRGGEPGPGDSEGTGAYERFAVVTQLGAVRLRRVPVWQPRFSISVYGISPRDANDGYLLASAVFHDRGVRTYPNGLGIWTSHDDSGPGPGLDPRTKQPFVSFIVELTATTQAVAS